MSVPSRGDRLEETIVVSGGDVSDRLLQQLASLPPDAELEDAIWALVSAFADGGEDVCIGVCVPNVAGEQLIVRHAPRPSRPRMHDAARLFPEMEHEDILRVPFDDGSSLHVGGPTVLEGDRRKAAELLALSIGSTVRRARHLESLKRESQEAKSLREQAVQSDKLANLGRMAASVVHELNNPLTSIVAYTDLLRRRFGDRDIDPSDRERLVRISEAASRVLAFTRDLVAYSRPSPASPSPITIHDVIDRALVFCDHVLSDSHVTVVRRFGEVPFVFGLHGPLTQVFVNLITNACQAMDPDGGTVEIETGTHESTGNLVVRILDQGPGIRPDIADRLFEPYFTTRGEADGNGLGLHIVQTILTSHGGSATARNRDGRGAVFTVELPARPLRAP